MSRLNICVCTSVPAIAEPRAPKHAVTLANLCDEYQVIFLDCIPLKQKKTVPKELSEVKNLEYKTYFYPHKSSGLLQLLLEKLRYYSCRIFFLAFGYLHPSALSILAKGLEKHLINIDADVYIGHNIDTLLPIYRVARAKGASIIFDCMEFYSDMGDSQTPLDKKIVKAIEKECLPSCDLVLTSSDEIANELEKLYGINKHLPLYNTPHMELRLPNKSDNQFTLYWRNSVIGLGQRGLDDALNALRLLPEDISLHVQGNLPFDGGKALHERINELGLINRVFIHPPHLPNEAVEAASYYTVGLCLERDGIRNHDLTVSNKIFDYFMAGIAVIASDRPGLRNVINRSGGGLLFRSGCFEDLAKKILTLYNDRKLLAQLASQGRSFALSQGNLEYEMKKFKSEFLNLINSKPYKFTNSINI